MLLVSQNKNMDCLKNLQKNFAVLGIILAVVVSGVLASPQQVRADFVSTPDEGTVAANNTIYASVLSPDGSTLYIGGAFTSIGGQTRKRVAAISTSTGTVTSFDPNILPGGSSVRSLAIAPDGSTLYMSGSFSTVGGVTRPRLAAVNTSDGTVIAGFNSSADNLSHALTLSSDGSVLYAGGTFTTIGGVTRNRLAAINTSDGTAISAFNPNVNNTVRSLALSSDGSKLYVGGAFVTIGGATYKRLAAINTSDGTAVSTFSPNVNDTVRSLVLSPDGSKLYAGGAFTTIAGVTHNRLAAINTSDGVAVSTFNPDVDSGVSALVLSSDSSRIYLGGDFTAIGGVTYSHVAAINTSDGTVVSTFSPNVNDTVRSLALSSDSSKIYLGGDFTTIVGDPAFAYFASFTNDVSPPMISNITSAKANGAYKASTVIDINLTFSENVTSTGDVIVNLDTGGSCTFTITNSNTGSCDYTINNGEDSSDLNVSSVSGTVKDAGNNDIVNFTPVTNLAANKDLVIDTTLPSAPGIPYAVIGTNLTSQTWNWVASTDTGSGLSHYHWQVDGGPSGTTTTTTITTNLAVGNWKFHVKAEDNAGNQSTAQSALLAILSSSLSQITIDNSVPIVWVITPSGILNPVLDLSPITSLNGDLWVASLNTELHLKTLLSSSVVIVDIPAGAVIEGPSSAWTKILIPPTVITPPTALLPVAPLGFSNQAALAILVGHDTAPLNISRGVRIFIEGQSAKKVGHITQGVFTEIINTCSEDSQAVGDALAPGQDCKIEDGSDLIIWSKHFSSFVIYDFVLSATNTSSAITSIVSNRSAASVDTPIASTSSAINDSTSIHETNKINPSKYLSEIQPIKPNSGLAAVLLTLTGLILVCSLLFGRGKKK